MPGPNVFTEGLNEIADVVASRRASTGEILVNLGDAARGTGIDSDVSFWGVDGFYSRPANPDSRGSAQHVFFVDGNRRFSFGSRDRRFFAQIGTLDPGDRSIATPNGVRAFYDDSAAEIVERLPNGATRRFSADGLFIDFPNGASYAFTPTGATMSLPDGTSFEWSATVFDVSLPTAPIASGITLDANGFVVSVANLTQTIHLDAGSFVTLGLNTGGVRPGIPTVENVNIGPGGGATIPSPKVFAQSTT